MTDLVVAYQPTKNALQITGGAHGVASAGRINGAVTRPTENMVLLPATAAFAAQLDRRLPDANWTSDADRVRDRARRAIAARPLRVAPVGELPELPGSSDPAWLHQRQAYAFAREQEGCGLWIAMGGGKSRIGVALAVDLEDQCLDDASPVDGIRVLVTCPRSVLDDDDVWATQFARWAPDRQFLVGGRVMRSRGAGAVKRPSVKQRLATLIAQEHQAQVAGLPFVAVVPIDSFWREPLASWILGHGWSLWLDDEIHRLKAPGGKAGKFAARVRSICARRVGLSGTALPHSRLDAYGVYRALDPGVFGTNYHRFKRRYAVTVSLPNAPGAEKIVDWQNLEDFDQRFHSIAYVWERDREVLGTHEPVVVQRHVPLTPKTWRIYRDLERDLVADIGQGIVTASNALVRLLRLQQVLSGVATTSEGNVVRVGSEKADALADLLEDLPAAEPVVAFGRFHGDLDSAHQAGARLGRRVAELSGRTGDRLDLGEWKAARADVLAVQIQAGGSGIDLTRAHNVVYLSTGFSLGDHDQSRDRVDRPGQLLPPLYVYLVAEGPNGERTVDHDCVDALDGRRDVIAAILAARQR